MESVLAMAKRASEAVRHLRATYADRAKRVAGVADTIEREVAAPVASVLALA